MLRQFRGDRLAGLYFGGRELVFHGAGEACPGKFQLLAPALFVNSLEMNRSERNVYGPGEIKAQRNAGLALKFIDCETHTIMFFGSNFARNWREADLRPAPEGFPLEIGHGFLTIERLSISSQPGEMLIAFAGDFVGW